MHPLTLPPRSVSKLLLALLTVGSASWAAGPTAMFIPKAINLEQGQVETLGAVCALQYARVSLSEVRSPAESQAAVGPNGSLVDAAKSLNATELVELTVVSLATRRAPGRMLISAVRRSVEGAELYRADVTADSLDDAMPACERLALALTRKVAIAATLDRHNVTAAEARASRRPNRVGNETILGVKTSLGVPLASFTQVNPIGGLAFDIRLDREHYFIELGAGVLIPAAVSSQAASYGGIGLEVGASYYLSDADTSAYLGGGLQPRIIFSGSVLNFAPYAQLGVMFWRQSSTRLYVDLRVSQNVLPVGDNLYPTEIVGQVGLGW